MNTNKFNAIGILFRSSETCFALGWRRKVLLLQTGIDHVCSVALLSPTSQTGQGTAPDRVLGKKLWGEGLGMAPLD